VFQRQIRDLIPELHAQIATVTRRIIVGLSNVTHVDSTGLGALLRVWTAAQNKGCDLEIANLNSRVEKLVEITRLDTVFKRARVVAAGASAAALPAVGEPLTALEFRKLEVKPRSTRAVELRAGKLQSSIRIEITDHI